MTLHMQLLKITRNKGINLVAPQQFNANIPRLSNRTKQNHPSKIYQEAFHGAQESKIGWIHVGDEDGRRTDDVRRKVVGDEAGRLGAPVAVVDADEGGGGARLDLAVVLQHVVRLHDGEGELARRVPREVPRPQQLVGPGPGVAVAVIVAVVLILPRKRVPPDPVPARGRNPLQPRPHPSSPFWTRPCNSSRAPRLTRELRSYCPPSITQFHLKSSEG